MNLFGLLTARAAILTMAVAAGMATRAWADFSGDYALTPPDPGVYYPGPGDTDAMGTWRLASPDLGYDGYAGTNFDDTNAPASLTLNSGSDPIEDDYVDLDLSNTAPHGGTLSFTYTFEEVVDGAFASYGIDGNSVPLTLGTHTVDVPISAGDNFDFELFAELGGDGSLTISDFSVPEPGAVAWLLAGAGGLLCWRTARRCFRRPV